MQTLYLLKKVFAFYHVESLREVKNNCCLYNNKRKKVDHVVWDISRVGCGNYSPHLSLREVLAH